VPTPTLRRTATATAPVAVLAVLFTGCSATSAEHGTDDRRISVENCGSTVTLDHTPERIVMLKSGAVTFLHALGAMDRVVSRAGAYPDAYFDEATRTELDDVPLLTDQLDASGHLHISKETVLAEEPDLVLGEVDNLSRQSLDQVGIPLIEEPALCTEGADTDPSFTDVYDQMATYGKVFGKEAQARTAIADLRRRVSDATVDPAGERRTAAVLYPTVGGGTTYAYGNDSMAQPQLEAAGFENVFADVDERVFEVTLEELLGRDPDVLVLLYSEGDARKVEEAMTLLPGADELSAVRNGQVMTQLFNFTEPATPLTVTGLERIVRRFGR